ncbi:MAG: hypothetical protein QHH02_08565 [Syntrophomonadaceae bacterium]|nr:hypothetical protein [Syntrophomonadaceae bacterium]
MAQNADAVLDFFKSNWMLLIPVLLAVFFLIGGRWIFPAQS